jgi:HEAT repeat protein
VLRDRNSAIRWNAAAALARVGTPAIESLVSAIQEQDSVVRWNATWALGEIRNARCIDPLIRALKDPEAEVRRHAADSLGRFAEPRTLEPLASVALGDADVFVRGNAVGSLATLGTAAFAPLAGALKDKAPSVRRCAARALAQLKDDQTVECLLDALREKDIEVVAEVHRFFIGQGRPGSEALLIDALTRWGDRTMAEDFLSCGNERLGEAARQWAKDRDEWIETHTVGVKMQWGAQSSSK